MTRRILPAVPRLFTLFAAFLVAFALSTVPGRAIADGQPMALPVDPTPLVVVTTGGERSFQIEIARAPNERAAGLMYRTAMPDDRGMLFVFEKTHDVTFWMKDTPMPLDLLFIGDDGRVKTIRQGEPQSVAIIPSSEPVRFVLELKAGTAARGGIARGDLVRHPALSGN
ncbi:DUF192 domain-containing protein [Manganibacter manganicus]|uniref:DUF192 domain-containing protein n=1 Tax=Manganibacter manganicus TaxID=1873176 RepID=A0A1V8RTV0_9HYPH|nr:DUF192 domain-containing protein [Pseudaminobacter manganicus]OQM76595.1 hypothetical protein BFN67_13245 [Pseudaminobacter manganicus]